eukprot:152919-Amphidinium_carterae.1
MCIRDSFCTPEEGPHVHRWKQVGRDLRSVLGHGVPHKKESCLVRRISATLGRNFAFQVDMMCGDFNATTSSHDQGCD